MTATIRQLCARGLVDRRADPSHERRVAITLTAAGRKAWSMAEREMTAVQDEVFGALNQPERELLRSLLTSVLSTPR